VSSSSRAAKGARRKELSKLNQEDVIDAHKLVIERLEEQFSKVEEELKGWDELKMSGCPHLALIVVDGIG